MRKIWLAVALLLLQVRSAHAFCGFYVNGAGGEMFNDATQVVLMRLGTRTVLSMQNSYQGPVGDFAMVVPVPVVLHEGDVKTLDKAVFAKVDTMGSPRLVEYWEQDPCSMGYGYGSGSSAGAVASASPPKMAARESAKDYGVTVEAQFVVGEYQVVILSAKDSSGLDAYLRSENYQIPDGAEPLLRPYVEQGSKFFVAKVDPAKVTFDAEGRAQLSPLRFHYDSDDFTLPIRLGLAASPGKQDLIVNILSPDTRYNVTNYKNVTIPTNLEVKDEVKNRFAEFYAALFDRTIERNPGAVVTEYAWTSAGCDPCPGPVLDYHDLATLGADVLGGGPGKAEPYQSYGMVLTRLHARYGKDQVPDDLSFGNAPAIVGGREFVVDQQTGKLEEGSREDYQNNFQGRYIIRHEWTGPIECASPQRHVWGGPPGSYGGPSVSPGKDLAHAPRGAEKLPQMVAQDVPEIGIRAAGSAPISQPTSGAEPSPGAAAHGKGCGCQSSSSGGGTLVLVAAALLLRRRRR
jgi:MYXO-CTERM domain-containing protein